MKSLNLKYVQLEDGRFELLDGTVSIAIRDTLTELVTIANIMFMVGW